MRPKKCGSQNNTRPASGNLNNLSFDLQPTQLCLLQPPPPPQQYRQQLSIQQQQLQYRHEQERRLSQQQLNGDLDEQTQYSIRHPHQQLRQQNLIPLALLQQQQNHRPNFTQQQHPLNITTSSQSFYQQHQNDFHFPSHHQSLQTPRVSVSNNSSLDNTNPPATVTTPAGGDNRSTHTPALTPQIDRNPNVWRPLDIGL